MSAVQKQSTELRDEACIPIGKSYQRPHESSSGEIIIGGWTQKSKDGAIKLVEKVIEGKAGQPKIMMEKVAMVPKEIPDKFDSKDSAELFVRQHVDKHADFPYRFDHF